MAGIWALETNDFETAGGLLSPADSRPDGGGWS